MMQVLAPGVEHGDETDLGAEMLRVGGDRAQRLGRRAEQDGVDRLLVLEGDLGDRRRQREDDMEVRHRQQLGLPGGQPRRRGPGPGTSGSAGCGRSCRRCGSARNPRTARCGRPAPPSDTARWRSSRAARRGRDGRHGRGDRRRRGGGRYPPPPRRAAMAAPDQAGGTTSSVSRSSGLSVRRMRPFETCV